MDNVVYSGDLAKNDEDGFIYFVGRKDHQITCRGYRASPSDLEALIAECSGVSELKDFGLYDAETRRKIWAMVSLFADGSVGELLSHCRAKAPHYLIPKEIFFISGFPRTPNGRIIRPLTIQRSIDHHGCNRMDDGKRMTMTAESMPKFRKDQVGLDTSAVTPDTALFTSKLLDSFRLVDLILFVE
jgi:acyl-coenzyme A synthetase/AMP-(fatty) acid ligase